MNTLLNRCCQTSQGINLPDENPNLQLIARPSITIPRGPTCWFFQRREIIHAICSINKKIASCLMWSLAMNRGSCSIMCLVCRWMQCEQIRLFLVHLDGMTQSVMTQPMGLTSHLLLTENLSLLSFKWLSIFPKRQISFGKRFFTKILFKSHKGKVRWIGFLLVNFESESNSPIELKRIESLGFLIAKVIGDKRSYETRGHWWQGHWCQTVTSQVQCRKWSTQYQSNWISFLIFHFYA